MSSLAIDLAFANNGEVSGSGVIGSTRSKTKTDLENHFDYIHYNPVKHQLVRRPRDWPASTFHRYVASGHYDIDWGAGYVEPNLPGDAGEWI